MNKTYKHVTNTKNGQLVTAVAGEIAISHGSGSSVSHIVLDELSANLGLFAKVPSFGVKMLTIGILGLFGSLSYAAAPVGTVAAGQATLVTNGAVLNVNQTSQAATINFQQLNLNKGEGVAIKAGSVTDITLLRVAGGMNVSGGFITANDNLLISSPGGININNGGRIQAQGEVYMTTQNMAVGQYTKPVNQANTGIMSISGQSQISGSNIVLDAGSLNLSNANVTATPVLPSDGIRVQGSSVNVQSSTLSAVGGKIVIGVDAQGNYSTSTTVQGSNLTADSVQIAGKSLNIDSSNAITAANAQIQSVDLLINTGFAKLISTLLSLGSNIVLIGDNSVTGTSDSVISANGASSSSLAIKTTGSSQNLPSDPLPSPNKIALSGAISLTGGRKSLLVNSVGDLDVDGANIDVSGVATFQALKAIMVSGATISSIGDLTVGRDSFGQGALSQSTIVFNSSLAGYNVETSGESLATSGVVTKAAGVWLLDPTNVTIATTASTGGTLSTALAAGGVTTIQNTDIQNAINAGTSVNIIASGTITQTAALTFTNSSGTASTLTLNNTSGSKQAITLSGGITATGSSAVNVVAKSAGGQIAVSGAISITGAVTLDNTYAVNGTTSGFITGLNAATYATGASTGNGISGIKNTAAISASSIAISGAYSGQTNSAVYIDANLTATTENININGVTSFAYLAVASASPAIYINRTIVGKLTPISITANSGEINFTGTSYGTTANVSTAGIYILGTASTGEPVFTAKKLSFTGSSLNTAGDNSASGYPVYITNSKLNINASADYSTGGAAISFNGTSSSTALVGAIQVTGGSLNVNSSGGDISFVANNYVLNGSAINVAKNTGTVANKIIFDTTSGNANGKITNTGAITVTSAGAVSPTNLIQKSNGATIRDAGAVSVTGYINIDNTNGSASTATALNANGVVIMATLASGALAGPAGVVINATASGTGIGITNTYSATAYSAAINSLVGSVDLTAKSTTASSIDFSAVASISSAAGIAIVGSGSSSAAGTAGAVSVLGAISNTGAGGISISSTGNTATGNVSDSGAGGIGVTGGYGVAAGTTTNGTITAVGTLTNTGGGVISLSMAQPTSTTGGAIETAAGITSANASTASNISYNNIGGVMGAVNVATVNSVNYRTTTTTPTISITTADYSEVYGTAYNSAFATAWLENSANTTITISGGGSNFGVITPTASQALASLTFASDIGGTSNNVQSLTSLAGTTKVLSGYGVVTVNGGTYTITPAVLTVTGNTVTNEYSGATQTLGTYSVSGYKYSDTATSVGLSVSGSASRLHVGTTAEVLSSAVTSGNYTLVTNNGSLTITPYSGLVTITGNSNSTTYNATSQSVTGYTATGLLGAEATAGTLSGVSATGATGTNATSFTNTVSGSNPDYSNIVFVDGLLNIAKANATLVGAANTRIYNSNAQTNTGAVFGGLLGNDSQTISATGYAVATHVAQGAVADNISATGTNSSNYNFTVTNGSLRITPTTLSVVGAQTTSVYDATTKINTLTTTGLLGSDAISVTGKASAVNVSVVNDSLVPSFTSGSASDYAITVTNGFLKITPKTITISGITADNKQYDGTSSATLNIGSVVPGGVISGDTVSINTGTLTGAFADKNVADGKTVIISGISLSGPSAGNYQLSGGTTATTTANITPAPLTVNGTSVTTTYNGANQSLASPTTTGLFAGDNVIVSGTPAGTGAGTYTANYGITGTDSGNYALTRNAPTLVIQKAALVVTADNNGKIVTQADPLLTAQLTGLQGTDTATALGFTYSVGRATGETVAGGPYAITATPTGVNTLSNYTISYVPGVFTITPAGTVLIKMNPTTSTYGSVVQGAITSVEYISSSGGNTLYTLTPISNGSNTYTDGVGGYITITPSTTVTTTTGVGTYVGAISNTNTALTNSGGNFSGVSTIVNNAVVTQAPLTISIDSATKTYDAAAFTASGATATPSGLMNGQTLAGLGGITYSGTAIGAINASASTYSLLGSVGSGFANYNVTVVPGTLTVNQAPLSITGGTGTYTFNNTTRTNAYSVSGLQGTDSVTGITGSASGLHAVTYTDNLSNAVGTGLSNYSINYVNGSITITPAQLTAVATPTNSPVYSGGTSVPNTTVLSGVIGGTVVNGSTNLALSGANVGTETIINNGTTLTGPNAGDYVVISSNLAHTSTNLVTPNIVTTGNGGGSVVITPAPLTITGGTASFVFDNTTHNNTFSTLGLLGNDSVTGVLGSVSQLHAGTYVDVLSGATGVGINNYTINYVNGGITINRAPLTALATPSALTYTGLVSVPNTTALSGVIAGTSVDGTTSLTLGSPNAGTQTITNNGTALSGPNGGDYYVVSSNVVGTGAVGSGGNGVTSNIVTSGNGGGTIPVAKAPLSIVGATSSLPYNGIAQTNAYSITGTVNGESVTASGSAQATHVSDGTVADVLTAVAGSGVNLNNYSITVTNGSIAITPLAITGTAQVAGKTYDGTGAATGSIALNGVLAVDQGTTSATGAFTFNAPNSGSQTATVSNLAINNSDYTLTVPNLTSTTIIAKAPLIVTGDTTTGITFNNSQYVNGYTSTGTLYGTDSITGVIGSATSTHAGTYTDVLTGATGSGISNYDITYVNGSITINRAPLTALATPSALTYTGLVSVPNTTALSGVIAGTSVDGTTSLTLGSPNAGTQTITNNGTALSGPNGGDYYVVSSNVVGTGAVGSGGNGVTSNIVTSGNGGGTIPVAKAIATVYAVGAITSPNPIPYILPPTPPVFAEPLDQVSDIVINVNDINLAQTNKKDFACESSPTVLFEFDSAELTREAQDELRKCRFESGPLTISGFTDGEGASIYNVGLGKRRAQAVQNFISQEFKIPKRNIEIKSFGKTNPVDTNLTDRGRAQNRRVQIGTSVR